MYDVRGTIAEFARVARDLAPSGACVRFPIFELLGVGVQ